MDMSLSMAPLNFSPSVPKYGTLIPNRIFVGGIANDTTESELKHFFSAFGPVRDCKIIFDRAGLSKSYGFVTFESQDDAEKVMKRSSETLILRDRKLNIGPAIKKQQQMSSRFLGDHGSPSGPAYLYSNGGPGVPYALPNGIALYCTTDGSSYLVPAAQQQQPAAVYHPTVMSSYYSSPNVFQSQPPGIQNPWNGHGNWRWNSPNPGSSMLSPGQYLYPVHPSAILSNELLFQPSGHLFHPSDSGDA